MLSRIFHFGSVMQPLVIVEVYDNKIILDKACRGSFIKSLSPGGMVLHIYYPRSKESGNSVGSGN